MYSYPQSRKSLKGHQYSITFVADSDTLALSETLSRPDCKRLEDLQWIEKYNLRYVPDSGDLVLVIDEFAFAVAWNGTSGAIDFDLSSPTDSRSSTTMLNPIAVSIETYDASQLPAMNMLSTMNINPANYTFYFRNGTFHFNDERWLTPFSGHSAHITYYISRTFDDRSKIQIALPFMLIVMACNLGKAIVMFIVLQHLDPFRCVRVGDALASFFERPDPSTIDYCIAAEHEMTKPLSVDVEGVLLLDERQTQTSKPVKWQARRRRFWLDSVASGREMFIFWLVVYDQDNSSSSTLVLTTQQAP